MAKRLKTAFNVSVMDTHRRLPSGRTTDLYASDGEYDYFIEVKKTDCNRVVIGQMVEFAAEIFRYYPKAKLLLICKKVKPEIREIMKNLDIEILTFQDLNIFLDAFERIDKKRGSTIELSPSEQTAYFLLQRKGLNVVSTRDLARLLGKSSAYARNLMTSLFRKGALHRIGRGKYVVISADVLYQRKGYVTDPLFIVDQLLSGQRYYIGYQSAAYFHGFAHQIPFDTNVVVLKQRRSIRLGSTKIRFIKTSERKFFGFSERKYSEVFINVSDVEKTILDCLDRSKLCGGIPETTRMISICLKEIDWDKLLEYLRRIDRKTLVQRLGFILQKLLDKGISKIPEHVLRSLETLTGPHIYLLDPSLPRKGITSKRWRITENRDCLSWLHHAQNY